MFIPWIFVKPSPVSGLRGQAPPTRPGTILTVPMVLSQHSAAAGCTIWLFAKTHAPGESETLSRVSSFVSCSVEYPDWSATSTVVVVLSFSISVPPRCHSLWMLSTEPRIISLLPLTGTPRPDALAHPPGGVARSLSISINSSAHDAYAVVCSRRLCSLVVPPRSFREDLLLRFSRLSLLSLSLRFLSSRTLRTFRALD